MKPLQPLNLSPIMTFGLVATLALSAGAWWKDRVRLHQEIERLHWQMSYPVHPNRQMRDLGEDSQLVGCGYRSALHPSS
jgi:hypothetical protein